MSARKARLLWLWRIADRMERDDRPPRWFWRWLLGALDRANGHRFEYLEGGE